MIYKFHVFQCQTMHESDFISEMIYIFAVNSLGNYEFALRLIGLRDFCFD